MAGMGRNLPNSRRPVGHRTSLTRLTLPPSGLNGFSGYFSTSFRRQLLGARLPPEAAETYGRWIFLLPVHDHNIHAAMKVINCRFRLTILSA